MGCISVFFVPTSSNYAWHLQKRIATDGGRSSAKTQKINTPQTYPHMHNVESAVGTAIGAKTPRRVSTQGFWDAFGSCDKPDFILFSKSKAMICSNNVFAALPNFFCRARLRRHFQDDRLLLNQKEVSTTPSHWLPVVFMQRFSMQTRS